MYNNQKMMFHKVNVQHQLELSFLMLVTSIIVALFSMTGAVYAQNNTTNSEMPKFLSIQHAQSGSISEINATTYSLQLNEVTKKTILFSDRPDRIVTSISTDNYIGNWSAGVDSFAADAPNAVLVVDEKEGPDTIIMELFNPVYDENKKTLKYEIRMENLTSIEGFGRSTLIIDIGMSNAGTFA
jgi:hypothetical protein